MNSEIEKYRQLEAEHEILVEICSPLFQIKYILERMEKYPNHTELLAEDTILESATYLRKLEARLDENERERKSLAVTFLRKDHGINIGEKHSYHHSGKGASGVHKSRGSNKCLKA
jgi:hypothetical protein